MKARMIIASAGGVTWLGGIGFLIAHADSFFNVHASSPWLFFAAVLWIVGIPVLTAQALQKRYAAEQRQDASKR